MARPKKATVDYFPHYTEHGKTLYVLESRWGNDGYAAWFKILERLGQSDGHYIDCRGQYDWQHLVAVTRVTEDTLKEIVDILTILGALDRELWHHGIIYCQKFVDGVTDAYRRRANSLPSRDKVIAVVNVTLAGFPPSETPLLGQNDGINGINDGRSTERERERERERGKKEDIGDKSPPPSSLLELWNRIIDTPKAMAMNKSREAKSRLRLRERGLRDWEQIFLQVRGTPFLCGDNDRGWRADFDWIIMNDTNAQKVIEGKYAKGQVMGTKATAGTLARIAALQREQEGQ